MTQDQILKRIRKGEVTAIVCRSASEPIKQGFIRHHCALCRKEVQVSPTARQQIMAGGTVLCNPGGIEIIEGRALAAERLRSTLRKIH